MIRRLRIAHRVIFPVLTVALLVILITGLRARPASAPSPMAGSATQADANEGIAWVTTGGSIRIALRPGDSGRSTIILRGADRLRVPGLLLFWSSRSLPISGIDSSDTQLGALRMLPREEVPAAIDTGGTLLLYSAGHETLVGALPVSALKGRAQ